MTAVTQDQSDSSIFPDAMYKKPWLGILAVLTLLAWQAFGHTLVVFQREWLSHDAINYMNVTLGFIGFCLVWRGFGKDELTATCYGALGGGLIWFGWFEHTFEIIAQMMDVPPIYMTDPTTGEIMYKENGDPMIYFTGGFKVMQTSGILLFPVLMLLLLNKDTRCRLFLFFHRRGLKPETPTVGYRRQYSRITALEYIFVTWFIYILCLTMLDGRLMTMEQMFIPFVIYVGWAIYLAIQLPKQSGVPQTLRYAIGAGIAIWLIPEWLAATQMIKEIWLHPFDYPISMTLITGYMVASAWGFAVAKDRGMLPKKKKKAPQPAE